MEMMIAYVLLGGGGLLFMCNRGTRGVGLLIVLQAAIPLLILALVVCNIGTLYRMRYMYWHLFLGLGVIGWGMCIERLMGVGKQR